VPLRVSRSVKFVFLHNFVAVAFFFFVVVVVVIVVVVVLDQIIRHLILVIVFVLSIAMLLSGFPGVYTNVNYHLDFITSHVDGYTLQDRSGNLDRRGANKGMIGRNQNLPWTGSNKKCSLVVHYDKAGQRKSKFCMSKKFMRKAANLCKRRLWKDGGVVADVCCHTCAAYYSKRE